MLKLEETRNMSKRAEATRKDRREFLKKGMAALGGAATLAVAGRAGAAVEVPAKPEAAAGPDTPAGYHVTPHISEYYDKARF